MRIDIRDGAMVIAEQNLSLLDGKVSRLIGLHAGKLKGGAAAPLPPGHRHAAPPPQHAFRQRQASDGAWIPITWC